MDYLYKTLKEHAQVRFHELDRSDDGSVSIEDIQLVYDFEGMFQLTDNKVRLDAPLTVDIWFHKRHLYEVEAMVFEIDKSLSDSIIRLEEAVFTIERDPDFLLNIQDEDINIRRKRMKYLIRHYSS